MTALDEIKDIAADLLTVYQKFVESGKNPNPSVSVLKANKSVGVGELNFR